MAKQAKSILYITGILILCVLDSTQGQVCSFGVRDTINQSLPYTVSGQYLDLNNTAPCDGNVTSIQYCFLPANATNHQSGNETNTFSLRIWREMNSTYSKVHELIIDTSTSQEESTNSSGTICKKQVLNDKVPLQILSGDILGIYFETLPFALLATNSVMNQSQETGAGEENVLYFDARPSSEVQGEVTIRPGDLVAKMQLQHHIKIQIGYDLILPQQTFSAAPTQTYHLTASLFSNTNKLPSSSFKVEQSNGPTTSPTASKKLTSTSKIPQPFATTYTQLMSNRLSTLSTHSTSYTISTSVLESTSLSILSTVTESTVTSTDLVNSLSSTQFSTSVLASSSVPILSTVTESAVTSTDLVNSLSSTQFRTSVLASSSVPILSTETGSAVTSTDLVNSLSSTQFTGSITSVTPTPGPSQSSSSLLLQTVVTLLPQISSSPSTNTFSSTILRVNSSPSSYITPLASERTKSSTLVNPTKIPGPSSGGLSLQILIIVGVLCAVVLLLIFGVVTVVCCVMIRSRRTAVHSTPKRRSAYTTEDDLFIFNNDPELMETPGGFSNTVILNEIHLNASFLPESRNDDSQGSLSDTDPELDISRPSHESPPSSRKHKSAHLYCTIETLQGDRSDHQSRLNERARRTQSDIHDYDDLQLPSSDHLHPIKAVVKSSGDSVEDKSGRTGSSVPSEYEVPSVASRCSTDCTLRCSPSPSSESSYEFMESISADIAWGRYDQGVGMEIPPTKRTETQLRSRASMDGPYSPPPSDIDNLKRKLKALSIDIISKRDIKTELGMLQPSLITQRALLKKQNGLTERQVTIKAPDPAETETDGKLLLLQEAIILGQIRHPNVTQFHGVIMEDTTVMLVMEQFPKEDLRRYLVQLRQSAVHTDAPKLLLSFSQQVALGMHYLSSKGFVHRDLAARNIFVTKNDICKVGELAKCLEYADPEEYVTRGGKLPIRWMPPEAMYKKRFSTASDVWSYGCLLYEIWSLGRMPFREFTNAQVIEKVDAGYRIPPPPGCPRLIYNLMIQCWHPNPLSRPSFKDLLNTLLKDESQVLQIPAREAAAHKEAIILGADLEAGELLYKDLQTMYLQRNGAPRLPAVSVQRSPRPLKESKSLPQSPHLVHVQRPRSPHVVQRPQRTSDYDHISNDKVMMTAFPTSSADIDHMYKKNQEVRRGNSVTREDSFDLDASFFRQRLLTDDKSDYADICD